MPAAIALSPALLRAALKVKNIVPQSTIPGGMSNEITRANLYCHVMPCPNEVKQGTGNIFAATLMPGMFVVALPLLYCPMAWGTLALDMRGCFCIWRPRVGMVWNCMLWWHCARCIIRTDEVHWGKYMGRSRRFCMQKRVVACRCRFFSSVSKIHVGQL